MNRTSCVSSAISARHNYQFHHNLSLAAKERWVRCWTMDLREISDESLRSLVDCAFTKNVFLR